MRKYAVAIGITIVISIFLIFVVSKLQTDARVTLSELDNEPGYIRNISKRLQALPTPCTREEFSSRLVKLGMNSEPDHYKDFNFYWSITAESYDKPGHIVDAEFLPDQNANQIEKWILKSATIHSIATPGGPWRPVWRIKY